MSREDSGSPNTADRRACQRRANASTTMKPALWRVASYCAPGFPRPTINASINETLSRTVITNLATILTLSGLLVFAVGSIWDFAMAIVPGWHATIFGPYFVAGAIFSGFAMVLTLAIPLRRWYQLEDFIKPHKLEDRIYRHRCVEAWSMVIPWVGFPLKDLIRRVEPQGGEQLLGADDAVPVARHWLEAVVGGDRRRAELFDLLQHRIGEAVGEGVSGEQEQGQPVPSAPVPQRSADS